MAHIYPYFASEVLLMQTKKKKKKKKKNRREDEKRCDHGAVRVQIAHKSTDRQKYPTGKSVVISKCKPESKLPLFILKLNVTLWLHK